MAKTYTPLWCLRAWKSCQELPVSFWCGSVGSGVFRRERDYTQLERYYYPIQPSTERQVSGWNKFSRAVSGWQALSSEDKAAWNFYQDYRRRKPVMSGYNLYISQFMLTNGNPVIPPFDEGD